MLIGIGKRRGSFSDRWIEYCGNESLNYLVFPIESSLVLGHILDSGVTHFLWHYHHEREEVKEFAAGLFHSLEKNGVICFPDVHSRLYFDSKIIQALVFQGSSFASINTEIFLSKDLALDASKPRNLPTVAKLSNGAGASNVRLLSNTNDVVRYIRASFGKGIKSNTGIVEKARDGSKLLYQRELNLDLVKKILIRLHQIFTQKRVTGYVLLQEYLENNDFDTRVIVVGARAIAVRRFNRQNDFRASGSGLKDFNHDSISIKIVEQAFHIVRDLKVRCCAMDFIYGTNGSIMLIEVSYGFNVHFYDGCYGYWDDNLVFHYRDNMNPQGWIIDDLINA